MSTSKSESEKLWRKRIDQEMIRFQTLMNGPLLDGQTFRWECTETLRSLESCSKQMSVLYHPLTHYSMLPCFLLSRIYSFLPVIYQFRSWTLTKNSSWLPLQASKCVPFRTFEPLQLFSEKGSEFDGPGPHTFFGAKYALNAGIRNIKVALPITSYFQIQSWGLQETSHRVSFELSPLSTVSQPKQGSLSVEKGYPDDVIQGVTYDESADLLCVLQSSEHRCVVSRYRSSEPFDIESRHEYGPKCGQIYYARFFPSANRLFVFRIASGEPWCDWVFVPRDMRDDLTATTLALADSILPLVELLSGKKEQVITRVGTSQSSKRLSVIDFCHQTVHSFKMLTLASMTYFCCPTPPDSLVYCLIFTHQEGLYVYAYNEHGVIAKRWGMHGGASLGTFTEGKATMIAGHVSNNTFYMINSLGHSWSISNTEEPVARKILKERKKKNWEVCMGKGNGAEREEPLPR